MYHCLWGSRKVEESGSVGESICHGSLLSLIWVAHMKGRPTSQKLSLLLCMYQLMNAPPCTRPLHAIYTYTKKAIINKFKKKRWRHENRWRKSTISHTSFSEINSQPSSLWVTTKLSQKLWLKQNTHAVESFWEVLQYAAQVYAFSKKMPQIRYSRGIQ